MKVINAAEFGAAIRKRRRELVYTHAWLSAFTGFSVSFISDLERGKETTELGKALYLASELGLDCLMERRGES